MVAAGAQRWPAACLPELGGRRSQAAGDLLRPAREMKVFLLTPGTGSYHCGVCMRDNALARELHRQDHDAAMLPLYLPLTLDEDEALHGTPIFFGGINVSLQQKFSLFRHTPRWFDSLLNNLWLLRKVARSSA